jgi:hypothetical protein
VRKNEINVTTLPKRINTRHDTSFAVFHGRICPQREKKG